MSLARLNELFATGRPLAMGIINVTPDSFSDGNPNQSAHDLVLRAEKLVADGADVIDVGGESTRPHADPVAENEEIKRVTSFLQLFRDKLPDTPLSLDTTKLAVAEAALPYGVAIINDVSFLRDAALAELARDHGLYYVLMHARGTPQTMMTMTDYGENFFATLAEEIDAKLSALSELSFPADKIILDPGFGFAKTGDQNITMMENLKFWQRFSQRKLIGISRKRFLQHYDGQENPTKRDDVSAELSAKAIKEGFCVARVHNVSAFLNALNTTKI